MRITFLAVLGAIFLTGCQDPGLTRVDTPAPAPTGAEVAAANDRAARLEQEKANLAAQLRLAQAQAADLEQKLQQQSSAAATAATELEALRAENARQKDLLARLDQPKLEAQAAQAEAALKKADEQTRKWEIDKAQLQKDLLRQEKEIAVLREEVARRDAKLEQLASASAKPPAVAPKPAEPGPRFDPAPKPAEPAPKPPTPGTTISGEVIQARADMARVNIGSAAGVARGARLPILRGTQLVGTLEVSEVSPKESAGFVKDRRLDVKVGDRVSIQVK